jgi:hypothetical protein
VSRSSWWKLTGTCMRTSSDNVCPRLNETRNSATHRARVVGLALALDDAQPRLSLGCSGAVWTRFAVLPHGPGAHRSGGLDRSGGRRRRFQNPASKARQLLHELLAQAAHAFPRREPVKFVRKGPNDRDLLSDSEEAKFLVQSLVVGGLQRAKRREMRFQGFLPLDEVHDPSRLRSRERLMERQVDEAVELFHACVNGRPGDWFRRARALSSASVRRLILR